MADERFEHQHHEETHRLLRHLIHQNEAIIMALNAQSQAIVDAINASTNTISDAVTAATTAITDLVASNSGNVTQADVQPSLDKLNTIAAALKATATQADPAVNPSAPPIVVPAP